jgi:Parvulin-like peptidyl-prolyl isomerase
MMKKRIFTMIIVLILAAFTFTALASAAVVDKIVVVVNNEIITQREVDIMLAPVYGQYRNMYKGEELIKMLEDVREKILKQLIEDRLIFCEAKKLNIVIPEKEIDEKVDEMRMRAGSEGELENMLAEQNLTLNELRARYKEKIMIRKLIDQKIGARIIITPLEVKNYYNNNQNSFMQPEEIKLRTILIKPSKERGDQAGALQLIKDLQKRLKEGCDFEALAKEYSDDAGAAEGGLMGYVKKGDLMGPIEEVVFNLSDGDITNIIQSSLGYHIFKVDEKRTSRLKEFPEVRQDIEEFLYREKASQRLKGWIDSLSKSAYIEFK